MNKKLTFLLALTFLFLFSGSSVVFGDDLQDVAEAVRNKDYVKAYKLLLLLAQQGNSIAQYNLGAMYSNGQGVTQDFKEAIKWFQLAAKQEHPNAQYSLGLRYMQGQGVTQDFKEAIKWFRFAEQNGFTKARGLIEVIQKAQEHKTSTSEILEAGVNELIKDGIDAAQSGDFKTAHKIFSKYAKLGFSKAQYFLGAMYLNGDGVLENIKEATKWFKLAAKQGDAKAQELLASLSLNKKEPLIKPYIGVGPLEACSEWSNQTYVSDFIQNSLTTGKSPANISEKNKYLEKLDEKIPKNCLIDFSETVQSENDKINASKLEQQCSVINHLIGLLRFSKIYFRTILDHDCLVGVTFTPPALGDNPPIPYTPSPELQAKKEEVKEEYYDSGKLKSLKHYKNGKLTKSFYYSEDGRDIRSDGLQEAEDNLEFIEPFWIDDKWAWRERSTGKLFIYPDQKECRYPQPFGIPCVGGKPTEKKTQTALYLDEVPIAHRQDYFAYGEKPKGYPDKNNSVKVKYENVINGMQVEVTWEPLDSQSGSVGVSVLGEAEIKFTSIKGGSSFYINNTHFGISKDRVDHLNFQWNDKLGRLNFEKKDITLKYEEPKFDDSANILSNLGDVPFFFYDLDFDNIKELIVEGRNQGQRSSSIYKVYSLRDGVLVNKTNQVTDIEPFLELDGLSTINISNKTINILSSSGACDNWDKTYKFNHLKNGNEKGKYFLINFSERETHDSKCHAKEIEWSYYDDGTVKSKRLQKNGGVER
jgi:uncharacterized protein